MPVDSGAPRIYRPADYYSSASPERVLPEWAPFGCGAASILVLILLCIGGAYLSHGGLETVMDLAFGITMGELRGMYAADVTATQKQAIEKEIASLRKNLREHKIAVQQIQPVLESMRKAGSDDKVLPREADDLASAARKVNATAH